VSKIEQMVLNLVLNARDAARKWPAGIFPAAKASTLSPSSTRRLT
jgi:hypothetical protein